jgi:hypothetical protein
VATQKALISYPNGGTWFGVVFQQRTNNDDLIWPVDLYAGKYLTFLRFVGDVNLRPGNTYTFEVSDATPATERSDSHTVNAGSKPHPIWAV